jgi:hypothetical protein
MTTSQSPSAIAFIAYQVGQKSLPYFRHEKSPKKFTQPQLFACLVLKSFFNTDYRGIVLIVEEHIIVRKILGLEHAVPHYTTLQKASRRLLKSKIIKKLMREVLKLYDETKKVDLPLPLK